LAMTVEDLFNLRAIPEAHDKKRAVRLVNEHIPAVQIPAFIRSQSHDAGAPPD